MKKTVMITGVAGFIGSYLCDKLLEKGYMVYGLDNLVFGKLSTVSHNFKNKNFKFLQIDIMDKKKLNSLKNKFDYVLHLAAFKKNSDKKLWLKTLNINVRGTENILQLAVKNSARFIFASTSDIYGSSNELPFNETSDVVIGSGRIPRWSYAISKLMAEHLIHSYGASFDLKYVILRYFGAYGGRARSHWSGGHIPIFIKSAIDKKHLVIHGDGKQTRSMAYISDIITGTVLAMENNKVYGQIINIGNDEEISVINSARIIWNKINHNKKAKLKFKEIKKEFGLYEEIKRRIPDLGKAKKLIGYEPKISFSQGIDLLLKDLERNR